MRKLLCSTGALLLSAGSPAWAADPLTDMTDRLAATVAPGSPLSKAVVGGPEAVRAGLEAFIARHKPDEIILTAQIFDQEKRVRSLELAAQARDALAMAV